MIDSKVPTVKPEGLCPGAYDRNLVASVLNQITATNLKNVIAHCEGCFSTGQDVDRSASSGRKGRTTDKRR